jgi:hypothetical protein
MEKFVEKHDKLIHRALEISLGSMTWGLLTSPLWLGMLYPEAIVYMLTFFTVFWSYMAAKHTFGLIMGYRKYCEEMQVDWLEKCKELIFSELPDRPTLPKDLRTVKHMILIPTVSEPYQVINESFQSILDQTFDTKQMTIVYTIEEKYAEKTKNIIQKITKQHKERFREILTFVHPAGIDGEAIGVAAANRTWGAKSAIKHFKEKGENIREYIFSTIDADHVIHPQYISRLTHLYLTSDNRDNHYYSTAVHLFDNNIWKVPMMMRIEANAVTLGSLSDWMVTSRDVKDSFSSYSCSLQTLIDADYWDVTLGVDDTIFYWRAFIVRDGDFEGVPHFIPYSADAVEGKDFIDSHISLYKQLLRWGWGAIDFPLSVKEFLKNKRIPLSKKLYWMLKHIEKRVVLINIVFLITFGFSLVTMVNPYVKQSNFAYSLPDIMSVILTITLVFMLPVTYYKFKLTKPMPKNWSIFRKFLILFDTPLIIFNLLTYSFVPWIEAQTRMLLGKKMKDLYHTPKMR